MSTTTSQTSGSPIRTVPILLSVLALVLIFGGIYYWRASRIAASSAGYAPPPVEVTAIQLQAETLPQFLSATGSLQAVREVMLAPEVAGRVVEIRFEAGMTVNTGTELVRQLDAPERADRAAAAARLRFAEIQIGRSRELAPTGAESRQITVTNITAETDLRSLEGFRRMVIKTGSDGLVRLEDVATIEIGAQDYNRSAFSDGERAILVGLTPTPDGNPLEIVAAANALIPQIERAAPPGIAVRSTFDVARFVNASIDEVEHTLIEAVAIVVVVIFLFLGSLRAVIIPVVTIPLSLIGTAALMLMFGFSLNLLTLLAMVLAIGLVVDDAIVVVENIHRHIEEGLSPVEAALVGAREIVGPVIAIPSRPCATFPASWQNPMAAISAMAGARCAATPCRARNSSTACGCPSTPMPYRRWNPGAWNGLRCSAARPPCSTARSRPAAC